MTLFSSCLMDARLTLRPSAEREEAADERPAGNGVGEPPVVLVVVRESQDDHADHDDGRRDPVVLEEVLRRVDAFAEVSHRARIGGKSLRPPLEVRSVDNRAL